MTKAIMKTSQEAVLQVILIFFFFQVIQVFLNSNGNAKGAGNSLQVLCLPCLFRPSYCELGGPCHQALQNSSRTS